MVMVPVRGRGEWERRMRTGQEDNIMNDAGAGQHKEARTVTLA